jgi:hypothetical protein
MIDQKLIIKTYYSLKESLHSHHDINIPWAVKLSNILPEEVVEKINQYYDENSTNVQAWKAELQGAGHQDQDNDMADGCGGAIEEFEDVTVDSSLPPRRSLLWSRDSLLEEIHQAFALFSPALGQKWGKNVKLLSVNFWEDKPGFNMGRHLDTDDIAITLQVYLNDADSESGTEFFDSNDNILYKNQWQKNTGYTLNNTPDSWHGITTPGKKQRRSIYAIYQIV